MNETATPLNRYKNPRFDFVKVLRSEFLRRCKKNPQYSIRAFARQLDVDASTLAKILKGSRKIQDRAVVTYGKKLGMTPKQLRKFMKNEPLNFETVDDLPFHDLTLDAFHVISDWYHYAILELMSVKDFSADFAWIAKTLSIKEKEAQEAFERLVRLRMLAVSPDGKWIDQTGGYVSTLGNNFTAEAFKKLQKQLLEKAITSLEKTPYDERFQYSLTMAIDPKWLPQAVSMIKDFGRNLHLLMGEGQDCSEVYNLGVSLFPLTRIQTEKPAAPAMTPAPGTETVS